MVLLVRVEQVVQVALYRWQRARRSVRSLVRTVIQEAGRLTRLEALVVVRVLAAEAPVALVVRQVVALRLTRVAAAEAGVVLQQCHRPVVAAVLASSKY